MNWKLPFDIPLITPTLGLPLEFFSILGIIVFVVHICFIYMLIGASTASVIYNIMGVFKKDSNYDKFAYRMTNYTTVSENMGALWGVAPLLVISVLFTMEILLRSYFLMLINFLGMLCKIIKVFI